jgi:hypothetical protein
MVVDGDADRELGVVLTEGVIVVPRRTAARDPIAGIAAWRHAAGDHRERPALAAGANGADAGTPLRAGPAPPGSGRIALAHQPRFA